MSKIFLAFVESEKVILRFSLKCKEPTVVNIFLRKNKIGGHTSQIRQTTEKASY